MFVSGKKFLYGITVILAVLAFAGCPLETKEDEDITYTVTADGSGTAASTKLAFEFSEEVTGLTVDHITVTNGTGSVTAGEVSGNGKTWKLGLASVTGGTVTVKITKDGIVSATKTVTVYNDPAATAAPVAAPAGRTFKDSINVTLTSATADAEIYYTLNNIDPVQDATAEANFKYTAAITIDDTVILKARAFKEGLTPSAITREPYTKSSPLLTAVDTPTVSPVPPLTFYETALEITLTTATEDAVIHYTLDGSDPDDDSPAYTAPFSIGAEAAIDTPITVKAIAVKDFLNNSEVLTVVYTKGNPANPYTNAPTFSAASGGIDSGGTVSLTSADSGAIYYTLDGSTPTAESTAYTAPIAITERTLIKAIAVKASWNASEVAEAKYLPRISAGGMTWLDITEEFGFVNYNTFFAKGDTGYVVVTGGSGNPSRSWYSTDRLHWTEGGEVFAGDNSTAAGVAWGNGRFVAVNSYRGAAYSLDGGKTWTEVSVTTVGMLTTIVWGGPAGEEVFVAGGSTGHIFWSSDGITWTRLSAGSSSTPTVPGDSGLCASRKVNMIIWEGNKFVAVANYRDMAYSQDGKTWTNVSPGYVSNENFSAIIYTGTEYLVSSTRSNYYSFVSDFTSNVVSDNNTYRVQVYNNGIIIGSGNDGWAYSTDKTITWTPFELPGGSAYIYKIDGKLFSVGSEKVCIQE